MNAFKSMRAWSLYLLLLLPAVPLLAAELPDFRQVIKEYGPAVVNISTTQKQSGGAPFRFPGAPNLPEEDPFNEFFKKFFGERPDMPQREVQSLGSGFIISADGYVMTNAHVVKDADKIIVRTMDQQEKPAKVVGQDERTDVALLKIEADKLPVVKLGDSDKLEVGEWVMAIGSPFGLDYTATVGVVSALGRSLPSDTYVPFIQTDAAVNPGNSGGPLFNLQGQVIGVNSQIFSRSGGYMGLSFAIPINVAMQAAEQLKTQGFVTRGWLGVLIQGINQELAQSFGLDRPHGALVSQVLPNSPAAKAGIKAGDIILAFDDKTIEQSAQLPPLVGATPVGKTVSLSLLRDGKPKTIDVTIEKLRDEEEQVASKAKGGKPQQGKLLNMALSDLTREQRRELNLGERGVLVEDVGEGPAQDAGIQPDDVILAVNQTDVKSAAQFAELVKALPKGKTVPILVQRDGGSLFLPLKVPDKG
ncbi:MAG: DegQ family serine endoprotease [Candidatus Competibacteraceae bacterium]